MGDLPAGLAEFLHDHVSSYEKLETLLLLARSPERDWSAPDIAQSLNASVDSIEEALEGLLAAGSLLECVQAARPLKVRYLPSNQQVHALVTELQRAYVEQRLAVVQIMSANALERVRSAAGRRLAEAFRFERSKK
jgi:hypothetical protein